MLDGQQAYSWYRKAAAQDHARAQFALGLRHDSGQGVPRDYAAAFGWYLRAARQDHARAQFNLGLMYLSGQGAPLDLLEAWLWLTRAERGGIVAARKFQKRAAERMDPVQLDQVRQMAA
jgi:TPR repeat protein